MDELIAGLAAEQYRVLNPAGIPGGNVRIGERFYTFERISLFEGRMRLSVPAEFADMAEETARIKYPGSARPEIIKSDERGAACFTFGLIDSPLSGESVPDLTDGMQKMLQRLNPSWLFSGSGVTDGTDGIRVGFLEYKSTAIDDTVYNLMYFVPVGGITMMGTFSCPYGECEEWRPAVAEILGLIEVREGSNV
jgi:hypothetical protein